MISRDDEFFLSSFSLPLEKIKDDDNFPSTTTLKKKKEKKQKKE